MLISTTFSSSACGSQASSQVVRDDRKVCRTPAYRVPALAGTLAQLELLLKSPATDVEELTRLVRSDIGLCLQALRQSRSEAVESDELWRISDCVIHLGPRLLQLARPLCYRTEDSKVEYAAAEAFWMHSKLVATVAETTATYFQGLNVNPERAYLSGLMYNLDQLPDVLHFAWFPAVGGSPCTIQDWVAACNLPRFITDVQEFAIDELVPGEWRALPRVVRFAQHWIELCLPWSQSCMARRSSFELPQIDAANLIYTSFPDAGADCILPFIDILRNSTLGQLDEQRPEISSVVRRHRAFPKAASSYPQAKSLDVSRGTQPANRVEL